MTKRLLLSTVVLLYLGSAASAADIPVYFGNPPIKSVLLSSGGLAEIHRSAKVAGSGSIGIDVPTDQVDDILKSLVVRDPSGTVKDLSFAGPTPVEDTFKNMPFTVGDVASMPTLLAALKGQKVKLEGNQTVEGTILGVETQPTVGAGGQAGVVQYLNIVDGSGALKRVELDVATVVTFQDPDIRKKIDVAIDVIGRNVTDTAREVKVKLEGKGERAVDLSYVIAAPIWKTSYRVVVDKDGKARLQAWAVLENATGEDWKNVKLVLNSSSPVTLKQRLHDRYWKNRAELPIMVDDLGAPPTDTGSRTRNLSAAYDASMAADAPAPMMAMEKSMDVGGENLDAEPQAEMSYAQAATASEGDVSATFELDGLYDVANGNTVSLPIVDREVDAELVSLFDPNRGDRHPIAAVSMTNTTGVSLPGGILTVYGKDGAYVGDSSVAGLPVDDTRISSFALDKKVVVESVKDQASKTVEMKVADRVLTMKTLHRQTTTYVVKGAPDDERVVIIEHPKVGDGWKFVPSKFDDGESGKAYRLRVEVGKNEVAEVPAVFERVDDETVSLVDMDADGLTQWSSTSLDPATKDKLAELARAKREESKALREKERLEGGHETLTNAQGRIRANIGVVSEGSDQHKHYVAKLSEIEEAIERNEAEQAAVAEKLAASETRVGDLIRSF